MRSLRLGPCLILSAIFLFLPASGAQNAPTRGPVATLPGIGASQAPVGDPWQFHLGDDPSWSSPTLDDSSWQPISASESWASQTKYPNHFNYDGFAWYRRHIDIPAVPGAPTDLSIFLPPVLDVYQLYWNGVLIGEVGHPPPNPLYYFLPLPHVFGLGSARSGVLAIRVWKTPPDSFSTGLDGGFTASPVIGTPAAIQAAKASFDYNWLRNRQFYFTLNLLYGLAAALAVLTWLNDRSQKILFWMSIFAIAPVCRMLLLDLHFGMPSNWGLGLAQPFFALSDLSLWFLLLYLCKLDSHPRLYRFTCLLATLDLTVMALDGIDGIIPPWVPLNGPSMKAVLVVDGVLTAIVTPLALYAVFLVGCAFFFHKRLDPSRWLVASFAFLFEMLGVVNIALQQGRRFTHWNIATSISKPLFIWRGNRFNLSTILATLLFVTLVYAVFRFLREHTARQVAIEREFLSAQELQRVLVPETLPALPGYAVTSSYLPAQQVGGDFFQLIPLTGPNAGSALLLIGDVSGKGLKAAMTVSLIIGTVRTLAEFISDPAAILTGLNRRLYNRLSGGFVTCLLLRVDPGGACVLASAGHLAPIHNDHEIDLPPALPLGLIPEATYEPVAFNLDPADALTLYTDGLLEARDPHGELFGFDRVFALAATRPTAAVATQAAVTFGQDDDITVLTLTRLATGATPTTSYDSPALLEATT